MLNRGRVSAAREEIVQHNQALFTMEIRGFGSQKTPFWNSNSEERGARERHTVQNQKRESSDKSSRCPSDYCAKLAEKRAATQLWSDRLLRVSLQWRTLFAFFAHGYWAISCKKATCVLPLAHGLIATSVPARDEKQKGGKCAKCSRAKLVAVAGIARRTELQPSSSLHFAQFVKAKLYWCRRVCQPVFSLLAICVIKGEKRLPSSRTASSPCDAAFHSSLSLHFSLFLSHSLSLNNALMQQVARE